MESILEMRQQRRDNTAHRCVTPGEWFVSITYQHERPVDALMAVKAIA